MKIIAGTTTIKASSLSRIYSHYEKHDTGTISAFRFAENCGEGKEFSKKENLDNNYALKKYLQSQGFGVTAIAGTYIEGFGTDNPREVDEDSYFVTDLRDSGTLEKELIKLGKLYNQDSITFANAGGNYQMRLTNDCPQEIKDKSNLGSPVMGNKVGQFFSKIRGRAFEFRNFSSKVHHVNEANNHKLSNSEFRTACGFRDKIEAQLAERGIN